MEKPDAYFGLRFGRRAQPRPYQLIAVAVALGTFTLLWLVVPPSAMYWLTLALLAAVVWMATYGWRQALAALHDLLHQLEHI